MFNSRTFYMALAYFVQPILNAKIIYFSNIHGSPTGNGSFINPYYSLENAFEFMENSVELQLILLDSLKITSSFLLGPQTWSFSSYGDEMAFFLFEGQGCIILDSANASFSRVNFGISNSLTSFIITARNGSSLLIEDCFFKDFSLPTKILSLIIASDSGCTLKNIIFKNLNTNYSSLIVSTQDKKLNLSIDLCKFENITTNPSSQSPIVKIKGAEANILLNSITMSNIITFAPFFSISSVLLLKLSEITIKEVWAFSSFFNLGLTSDIIIENSSFMDFNIINNSKISNGGSVFAISNCLRINLLKNVFIGAFSDKTAPGLKIFYSSTKNLNEKEDLYIFINETQFREMFCYYTINNEIGAALLIVSDATIFIHNSTFDSLFINASYNASGKVGAPCILSYSFKNNLFLEKSYFLNSRSRFSSNAVKFSGVKLMVSKTMFRNNFPFFDYNVLMFYYKYETSHRSLMELHTEYGGSLLTQAEITIIENSTFFNNMGYMGGAMFVAPRAIDLKVSFEMKSSFLKNNLGGHTGGSLSFHQDLKNIEVSIQMSCFQANSAFAGGGLSASCYSDACSINIEHSIFLENEADYGGAIDSESTRGELIIKQSTFFNNKGTFKNHVGGSASCLKLSGINSTVFFESNFVVANQCMQKGTIAAFGGSFYDRNSRFFFNLAEEGSSVYALSSARIFFNFTSFIKETSNKSGTVSIKEGSVGIFSNVYFEECYAKMFGGVFVVSERGFLSTYSSTFRKINSSSGSILYALENSLLSGKSNVLFMDCLFEKNFGLFGGFYVSDSSLKLFYCSMIDTENNLILSLSSDLWVEGIKLFGLGCTSNFTGCVLYASQYSNITIIDSIIFNVSSTYQGAGLVLENSIANLNKNIFFLIEGFQMSGSCFYSRSSNSSFESNIFFKFNGNCFDMYETDLKINASTFINGDLLFLKSEKTLGAAIVASLSRHFEVNNCFFKSNEGADQGGALHIVDTGSQDSPLIISKSVFASNLAESGGALYIKDSFCKIFFTLFFKNSAGFGGAIFLITRDYQSERLILEKSEFLGNRAFMEGGALKVSLLVPDLSKCLFEKNEAQYGSLIASYPCRLQIKIKDGESEFEEISDSQIITLKNVSSGNEIQTEVEIALVDNFNQVVSTLNEGLISIEFLTASECHQLKLPCSERSGLNVLPSPILINAGKSNLKGLTMILNPDSLVFLKLRTEKIAQFYNAIFSESESNRNITGSYYKLLSLQTRQCLVGEIFIFSMNICLKCPKGKFSLKDPSNATCIICPEGANCSGGSSLIPLKGYWKGADELNDIFPCREFADVCLGKYLNQCSEGYTGPLCSVCDTKEARKFSRSGQYKCALCPKGVENLIKIIVSSVFAAILIFFLVYDSEREAKKLNSLKKSIKMEEMNFNKYLSVYLKIGMNYFQTVTLLGSFDLKWPNYVNKFLTIQRNIGEISTQIVSVEYIGSDIDPFYLNGVFTAIIPFCLILIFFLLMSAYNLLKKTFGFNHYFITFIVVSVFMQSAVLRELVKLVTCERLGNTKTRLLKEKRIINCDSGNHLNWTYRFTYPVLAYWVLLYPASCLIYLILKRHKLEEESIRAKFSFFIESYKPSYFYWEFYIMYQKITIIILYNLIDISINSKALVTIIICSLSTYLTFKSQPFIAGRLNILEFKSNISSLLLIFIGSCYISLENEYFQTGLFTALLIVQANLFYHWFKSLLETFIGFFSPKIYKFFPKLFMAWVSLKKAGLIYEDYSENLLKNFCKIFGDSKYFYDEYKNGSLKIEFRFICNRFILFDAIPLTGIRLETFSKDNIYRKKANKSVKSKKILNFKRIENNLENY